MKTLKTIAFVFSLATIFTSCSNDSDATPVNEEELITTITAVFTPEGGGTAITLESKDLDGDGPDALPFRRHLLRILPIMELSLLKMNL